MSSHRERARTREGRRSPLSADLGGRLRHHPDIDRPSIRCRAHTPTIPLHPFEGGLWAMERRKRVSSHPGHLRAFSGDLNRSFDRGLVPRWQPCRPGRSPGAGTVASRWSHPPWFSGPSRANAVCRRYTGYSVQIVHPRPFSKMAQPLRHRGQWGTIETSGRR